MKRWRQEAAGERHLSGAARHCATPRRPREEGTNTTSSYTETSHYRLLLSPSVAGKNPESRSPPIVALKWK